MKIQLQLTAALAVLLIVSSTLPVCAGSADRPPETAAFSQGGTLISDASPSEGWESVTSGDYFPSSDDTPEQEPPNDKPEESGMTVPSEAPMFSAYIEYSPQGYLARGTFTEFLPGTSLISPLYSLDGEVWQNCQTTWNLQWLGSETADDLKQLQNQTCLYSAHEPLASYLAGQLDRFYLKLQITLENGITYETRAAVIDRGDPQPIPEEFHPVASFVSDMLIRQWIPFMRYGKYQITVSADATPEDISALLPDTLPIEIQLYDEINFAAKAIVDCPVTWKPLSLSQLTADESVTIADAAEEIIVPAGTLLNTPCGIFQLNEPLGIDNDEIRLVLNVVAENAVPEGVLAYDLNGLQIAFHLKPTGATAIRAYTLSEDKSDWVELPDLLLPEEVNAPSSTAGSAYTYLLRNTSEPYQTYLTAWNAGDEPAPFLVGLKIEGGVYDGSELILAWPDTYELPTKLPSLSGSGGNECNAGSDNKGDSTLDGQRPGLPQDPEERMDGQEQEPKPPQDPKDGQEANEPDPPHNPKDGQEANEPDPPHNPKDGQEANEPDPPHNPKDGQEANEPDPPHNPKDGQEANEPDPPHNPKDGQEANEPDPPHNPKDGQDTKDSNPPQNLIDEQEAQEKDPPQNLIDGQEAQEQDPPQNLIDGQEAQEQDPPQNLIDGQEAQEQDPPQNPKGKQDTKEPEPPQSPRSEQDIQRPELSQSPKYKPEVQAPASYIPAARAEMQSAVSQAPEDQQPELPNILEKEPKDQQTQQISITKPLQALTVGAEKPVSMPGLSAETGSPAGEKNTLGTELSIYRFLFSAAATITMGLCIAAAAGKVLAGNMSSRISRKIMRAIYRFLHLK